MIPEGHPLLGDIIFGACIAAALESPCQKRRFGAALVHVDTKLPLLTECNRTITGLEDMCSPVCMRLNIQSRTESMLGACGHAEERVLWRAATAGLPMENYNLYVAGVDDDGSPSTRKFPEFTCLRCAVAIAYSGVRSVSGVFDGRWVSQTPVQALASARQYATGAKKA